MKKIIIALALCFLIAGIPVYAAENVSIPSGSVTLNGENVDSVSREYPLLLYKDITYFPMTYYDCRALGLTTKWDDATKTLEINQENISGAYRSYSTDDVNSKTDIAEICTFNIKVNGKEIDNKSEEYPLLTYRNVTYFPITWRFAVEEFEWEYSYSLDAGLAINSANYNVKTLNLPDIGGSYSVAVDNDYYYYTGNNNKIYRAQISDISKYEVIHTMPENGMYYADVIFVIFSGDENNVYMSYHIGGASTGTTYRYKINSNGTVEKAGNIGSHRSSGLGYNRYFIDGDTLGIDLYNAGHTQSSKLYITKNGEQTEIKKDGIIFGEKRVNGVESFSLPVLSGDILFVTGTDLNSTADSDLYKIDLNTLKPEKIISGVGSFYTYPGWDNSLDQMADMILYEQGGKRFRYCVQTGEMVEVASGLPLKAATGSFMIFAAGDDDVKSEVLCYDSYGIGSINGTKIFETKNATDYTENGGFLTAVSYGEEDIHFAVFNEYYNYFRSSDLPQQFFIKDGRLVYTVTEPYYKVVEVNLN